MPANSSSQLIPSPLKTEQTRTKARTRVAPTSRGYPSRSSAACSSSRRQHTRTPPTHTPASARSAQTWKHARRRRGEVCMSPSSPTAWRCSHALWMSDARERPQQRRRRLMGARAQLSQRRRDVSGVRGRSGSRALTGARAAGRRSTLFDLCRCAVAGRGEHFIFLLPAVFYSITSWLSYVC